MHAALAPDRALTSSRVVDIVPVLAFLGEPKIEGTLGMSSWHGWHYAHRSDSPPPAFFAVRFLAMAEPNSRL
jgi:hypothetical protein